MRLGQNDKHIAYVIFNCILVKEECLSLKKKTVPRLFPRGAHLTIKSVSIQVMTRSRTDPNPLLQTMPTSSLTYIYVIRPRWTGFSRFHLYVLLRAWEWMCFQGIGHVMSECGFESKPQWVVTWRSWLLPGRWSHGILQLNHDDTIPWQTFSYYWFWWILNVINRCIAFLVFVTHISTA